MKHFLLLRRLKIENANMVAGLTWGFPAISQFLGFTHALDRKLRKDDLSGSGMLGGCAIICHHHQSHTKADNYGAHHFCLTRNPLTKEGNTAPFNEEGRMHVEVSLLIELQMTLEAFYTHQGREDVLDEQNEQQNFIATVEDFIGSLRVAGGVCTEHAGCEVISIEGDSEKTEWQMKRTLFSLLPGFALVDRSELLPLHYEALRKHNDKTTFLEAWMDFGALRHRYQSDSAQAASEQTDSDKKAPNNSEWQRIELPERGWFVPLMTGYQPIAPLESPGTIKGSRDPSSPTCPVEAVYGVGQWLAPFRVGNFESLMWRYHYNDSSYQFHNAPAAKSLATEN